MGHLDAASHNNFDVEDCLASVLNRDATEEICASFRDAFSSEVSDLRLGEREIEHILAFSELAAAGLGRPREGLAESSRQWTVRNGELAAGYRERALEVIDSLEAARVRSGEVPTEQDSELIARLTNVRARIEAGRDKPMRNAKVRFLDHLARVTAGDGWKPRKRDATLSRPTKTGCQRVRFQLHGKHGIWSATLRLEVAFYEPQRRAFSALGRSNPEDACVVAEHLPREHYSESGKVWHLRLNQPGVDVPAQPALLAAGLRPADVLNPERTVRLAAERAAYLIREHGETFFDRYGDLNDLRPLIEGTDLTQVYSICPPGYLHVWIAVAWALDPALGERLLEHRRERLALSAPQVSASTRLELDRIEAALRES